MKKIAIILSLICGLTLVSCQGFLDISPSNQADSSTCITSEADAQVMMNGLMRKMTSSSYYGQNFMLFGDAKGGDFTIYTAGYTGSNMYYFAHTQTSNTYSGIWSQVYNCLLQANNIIVNIEELKKEGTTSSGLDNILGQAYTARALMFFDLVRVYGQPYNMNKSASGIAVVTEPVDAGAQLQRNTVEEVYTQILSDLNTAAPLLSKSKTVGYINYYANQAILGKVYMYMDNFSAAATAFANIIDSDLYSKEKLYKPEDWVASWTKQNGTESIFELAIYPSEGDLGGSSYGILFRRKDHGNSSAYGCFSASEYWHAIMDENDVRWGVTDYDHMHGTEARSSWPVCCYKYSGNPSLAGDGKSTSTAVNIKVIRLSEVYLLAAECYCRTNNNAKAAELLNAIAERNPNYTPWTSATVSVDAVFNEYRRELLGEGKLFFEAIRQNRTIRFEDDAWGFGTTTNYRESAIDRTFFRTILPISQDEINANPGIQQNPGY